MCMDAEREVDVRETNLTRPDELVAQRRISLIVPLLAVRALEVADFDHPNGRRRASLNPREVGARNVRVRWCASSDRRSLGASNCGRFRALSVGICRSAGEREHERSSATDAVDLWLRHLLNRPPARP